MPIDWERGYSGTFRVFEVDPKTWAERAEVEQVSGGGMECTGSGLLQSGSLDVTEGLGAGFSERYLRIRLDAEQGDASERVDVATMLFAGTGGEDDGGASLQELEGRSVLYPASTRKVHDLGNDPYAPAGADGAAFAAQLIAKCCHAPVHVECSFALGTDIVFDLDDSYLDAAQAVLGAGNCMLRIDGRGEVHAIAVPTEEAATITARALMPGATRSLDYGKIPNRYYAVSGSTTAVAVNDDPGSPTSTVSRGYYVDARDESPKPLAGETLAEYARRKLSEASVAEESRSYEREYRPGLFVGDLAEIDAPQGGFHGGMRIKRQSLKFGHGITVSEESSREVSTWQA